MSRLNIPRRKADVLRDYHGRSRDGHARPALNVKHYGTVEYTAERIVEHFGCTKDTAERARDRVYAIAQECFWEDALDTLNFAMHGDEIASTYAPCGTRPSPYKIYAEGRSGGWLVVEGLPDVDAWDGRIFQKWRKFARLILQDMQYRETWDFAREMIEANEMCPKAGTIAANREHARATPSDRLARAALAIHGEMDGRAWNADTLEAIAGHLQAAGLAMNDYDGPEAAA